jgi:predicted XRE-type DNA-binding protein
MQVQQFADVFEALADTPAEAAELKARSDLLSALTDRVKAWEMPRSAAASRLGIEPDRLDDLRRGKAQPFFTRRPDEPYGCGRSGVRHDQHP